MDAIAKAASALEKSKDRDGYTLIEHLTELIDRITTNPKEYPMDRFEELSYIIKLTRLHAPKLLADSELKEMTRKIAPTEEWLQQHLDYISDVSLESITFIDNSCSSISAVRLHTRCPFTCTKFPMGWSWL